MVADVGDRVQELMDAAERAAGQIQADAEAAAAQHETQRRAEADQLVEQRVREIDSIGRSLAGRVEDLQREATELIRELDDAARRLADLGGEAPTAREPWQAASKPSPEPVAYPGTAAQTGGVPEQATLRATQLAVAGTARADIERMLRSDFGVEDPTSVVDRVLRSESS